ncbi:1589_t:CDS:2 [Entrophospora sp. SA101]|nr:4641_t:CDS:2 [Entrophospora candida]CAH1763903.1 4976_t:CDS:2 [Entrophospora sp. SA101]CAJ0637977.1 11925_t:CDS:2 [Entrophospora sp. SA101]CAJ0640916.1 1589_t:CDS:2 [Entrophospora sp. SA101]CAJ0837154.1 353_t:CDS:2 [Entrophospora sp. SA101]
MSNEGENWDFMKVAPVLTGPFFIVIGYRFLALWYRRKEANEISQLESLRAQQSLKVEELKKKTGYYTTKTLLERYDSPTRLPTNQQPINNDQQLPRSTSLPLINQLNNSQNQQRYWYDKLVDAIVGEDEQKYALICKDCYTWNGLAFAADYDDPSLSTNNNLLSSSNGNLDASIDSLSPRRGRSTTPKQTSRDSSSDPENKRLASRSTSRKRKGSHHRSSAENDDNEGFEDNRFKHYNVKDGIDDNNE